MIKILYIAKNHTDARLFLVDLKQNLRLLGISNIRHEYSQDCDIIKTDKFFVKAKSIDDIWISKDSQGVNYYLEGISTAHYENEKIKQESLKHLRFLIATFKPGVIETNKRMIKLTRKEELIKILMGD